MIPGIVNVVLLNKRHQIISPASFGQGGASNVFNRGKGLSTRQKALVGAVQPDYLNGGTFGDPFWNNVVLLASFNGTNGATAFTDESSAANGSATFFGGAALSNGQTKFGYGTSLLTQSSGSPGGVTWPTSANWQFGTGKFTIECFAYFASVIGASVWALIANWNHSTTQKSWIFFSNSGNEDFNTSTTGSDNNADVAGTPGVNLQAWHHWAYDFDGTKQRVYFDGTMIGNTTTTRNLFASTATLSIGQDSANLNFPANIYFTEVRITKGIARYATDGSFTVPTSPFPRHG